MTVIIIEDEPLIASALEREILAVDPTIHIPVKLESISNALSYFSENGLPDLFFSDIQLSDGLSFEIFRVLKSTVPVIFCTAYSEYALEAFRQNGIDYLLKPIEPIELKATITKYKNLVRPITFRSEDLMRYFGNYLPNGNKQILIQKGDKIIPIKQSNVALFLLTDGIVWCYTFESKRYAMSQTLEEIERELDDSFYRANRQSIINKNVIQEVNRYFARKLSISPTIKDAPKIIISKAKAQDFLLWLAK